MQVMQKLRAGIAEVLRKEQESVSQLDDIETTIRHLLAAYLRTKERVRVLEKIAMSAYATPEWRANHRTPETDGLYMDMMRGKTA